MLLVLVALLPGCGGCGGGGGSGNNDPYAKWGGLSEEEWRKNREAKQKAEEEEKKAALAAEEARKKLEEERRRNQEAAELAEAEAAAQVALQPGARPSARAKGLPSAPAAALPLDIAEWKTEHYYLARAQADPRLSDAIALLGRRFVGNASAARLLTNLLSSDDLGPPIAGLADEDSPSRRRAQGNTADEAATVAAIAEALSINATPVARQTLGQIVGGELAGNVPSARKAALDAIAGRPSAETDAMLLEVLMKSSHSAAEDAYRNPDSVIAMLAALTPSGAESVRMEMATRMLAPSSSPGQRGMLAAVLLEPYPENLAAQAMLYHDFSTPVEMKEAIEANLTTFSSEVLRRLLGMPREGNPLTAARTMRVGVRSVSTSLPAPEMLDDPRLPTRMARYVWNESSVARLADRVYQLHSLDDGAGLVLLASSVPNDLLRSRLLAALERTWQEGPQSLSNARIATAAVVEPGFAVVLKTIARRAPANQGALLTSRTINKLRDRQETAKQWEKVAEDWRILCRDGLASFCDRLKLAYQARASQWSPSARSNPGVPDDFPVAIHDGARVVSNYWLDWPQQAVIDGQSLPVSPTQVRHVRIEETNRLLKVAGHYRHRLDGVREHSAGDVVWLGGLESLDGGQVRSVDVIIRRGKGAPAAGADLVEKLTIDVLAITIKNPAMGAP